MNAGVVAALLLVIGVVPAGAQSGQPPAAPRNQGRLFPPENLGLLEGPDRAVWQKPAEIMDALQIAEGATATVTETLSLSAITRTKSNTARMRGLRPMTTESIEKAAGAGIGAPQATRRSSNSFRLGSSFKSRRPN